ncbi:DUF4190 domain-containing protein [Demequina sp. NBRC 110057]|uniref:DUF4190 domain-containing protein n=1 Tax=Demequina sp. NBRC 110057 TaxID=1570346 RepID=UPI0013563B03|nr:DUF4190 domain-containing protein [Demequina sp. NBRC 110057]
MDTLRDPMDDLDGPAPVMPPRDELRRPRWALVSLIVGILGIALGFVPYLGILLGAVAAVLGHGALRLIDRHPHTLPGRGMALTGTVLGYAALAFGVAWLLVLMQF